MGASDDHRGDDQPETSESPEKRQDPSTASTDSASRLLRLQAPPSLPLLGSVLPETLASLGHEVRTPLAVIDGYTSTLLSHGPQLSADEHDEFLRTVQQATRHLEHITEQLLQIAELEAGVIRLEQSMIDLCHLARAAVSQIKQLVPLGLRGRFRFVVQCRDARGKRLKTPAFVQGDLLRLRQVVEHLLQNAVKFSPAGGRIDVIIQPASQAGDTAGVGETSDRAWWELCVCDFGVGIAADHLERIFEPFYRVDTRLTREQYGLGVGLAACRHLVRLHDGHIWAESCPDGGSAFHMWLPVADILGDEDRSDGSRGVAL
jgi:signal transduction histidine kinase